MASVTQQSPMTVVKNTGEWITSKPTTESVSELFEQTRAIHAAGDQWAIQEITVTDSRRATTQAICEGTAIAVSDGSYRNERGTAAFILEISDYFEEQECIVGVNSIPGEPEDHTSYRSELRGVSGVIETVNIVCKVHGITEGSIEVGLDGDQAMKNIFGKWPLNPRQADYDLLKDIRAKIAKSPLKWAGRWVKGHQDDHIRYEDMDRWRQLNVECDGLEKDYWNACNE
jgi:hypothetical protein